MKISFIEVYWRQDIDHSTHSILQTTVIIKTFHLPLESIKFEYKRKFFDTFVSSIIFKITIYWRFKRIHSTRYWLNSILWEVRRIKLFEVYSMTFVIDIRVICISFQSLIILEKLLFLESILLCSIKDFNKYWYLLKRICSL